MTAGKGVSGVDVSVAGGTEGGGVGFAEKRSGGAFTGLANPDTLVAGGDAVGGVDAGVATGAEVGHVGAAVDSTGSRAARVADTCPAIITGDAIAVALFQHLFLWLLKWEGRGGVVLGVRGGSVSSN